MNEGGYKLLSTAINNILFFVKVLYIYIYINCNSQIMNVIIMYVVILLKNI